MRFGTIQRPRPKHVRRRGEAVAFRMPFSHRERFWMLVISLLAMTALAVVIRVALNRPAGQPTPEWMGPALAGMVFPVLFILIAVLTPQRSLRITRRGMCFASTFRRMRRWVMWDEITGVWPGLRRIRSDGGEVDFFHYRSLPAQARRELFQELRVRLEQRFDLSQQTEYQRRLALARKRWTRRWLADRAALLGLALMLTLLPFGLMLFFLWLWRVHPALAFAAWGAVMACMFLAFNRIGRRNWIAPRGAESSR